MIFRQLFDSVSCTYTYLLASRPGGEALLIDPVIDKVDHYLRLLSELDLKLVKAVDTHVHADHISGLGALRDHTRCVTIMGRKSGTDVVSMRVDEGDSIGIETIALDVLYTPGHTDDSYCFVMADRVFTGDTLLIRGTGRTDFQHGDSRAAYESLFNKVLKLPDDMRVYPGHDYKGDTVSTIGEEKAFNPRLQVTSADEYAAIMDNLNLPNPKQMDVAVPANLMLGFTPPGKTIEERTLSPEDASRQLGRDDVIFVDLREDGERERDGIIPGSVHMPYGAIDEHVRPGSLLNAIAQQTGKVLVLYCAYGERSALALETLSEAGIENVRHLGGGTDAWIKSGGALEKT
ncbi:MAG: MBL fold metallo-hydrolase [Rhodospirillales bacterium]|jgi:glyoxylase-like metal-dependent hydrolase (beta-lactamase superfamily II)/rhodanese-related sulfurtransferase|nr:MBL fold metallo-hydrolase [Rhodospirillales bacterium]